MPRLKILSGEDVIKILESFKFEKVAQKGSHVKLRRKINKINQTITIPNHKELDKGTLLGRERVRPSTAFVFINT